WADCESGWVAVLFRSLRIPSLFESLCLLEPDTIGVVPARHVGQDDSVSFVQPFNHLDRIHRGSSDLYWHTQSPLSVRAEFEQTDGATLLPECWTADIEHVVHPLQVDGSVHAQVRPRALRKFPGEFDVDRHCSVLHGRIDPHYCACDHSVVRVDRRRLSNLYVTRL